MISLKHFKNNHFDIMLNSTIIGNICVLDYDDLCYVENFKIFEQYRNKGFGTLVLNGLKKKYDKIILISEINVECFYLKNGFTQINDFMFYKAA